MSDSVGHYPHSLFNRNPQEFLKSEIEVPCAHGGHSTINQLRPDIAGTVAHAIATDIDCAYFAIVRCPYGTYDHWLLEMLNV